MKEHKNPKTGHYHFFLIRKQKETIFSPSLISLLVILHMMFTS